MIDIRNRSLPNGSDLAVEAGPDPGRNLDAIGTFASSLCALHCAAMPALAALLPLAGLEVLGAEATEFALAGTSALLGIVSLSLGFRRHRSRRALAVLGVGLVLLAAGRILEDFESESVGVVAAVAGGSSIAVAHLVNRQLCGSCRRCRSFDRSAAALGCES